MNRSVFLKIACISYAMDTQSCYVNYDSVQEFRESQTHFKLTDPWSNITKVTRHLILTMVTKWGVQRFPGCGIYIKKYMSLPCVLKYGLCQMWFSCKRQKSLPLPDYILQHACIQVTNHGVVVKNVLVHVWVSYQHVYESLRCQVRLFGTRRI